MHERMHFNDMTAYRTSIIAVIAILLISIIAMTLSYSDIAYSLDDNGNVVTAENLDGNYAYVNYASVIDTRDGTSPFDKNDDPGNDSNEANGRVRSFDSVSYDIEYSIDRKSDSPYTYFENGRVGIKAILPYDSSQAEFAIDDMGWLDQTEGYKPTVTEETIDGKKCQVLIGYRALVSSAQNPTTIPGQGTLKLIINVKAMTEGEIVKPDIQLFADHNQESEYASAEAPETIVSSAPKYDIYIEQRQSRSSGRGDYPFAQSTSEYAIDKDAGDVNGAVAMYLLSFRIVNDSASKGMKGVEFPTSDYTFDLHFDSQVKAYDSTSWQSTPDDYAPKVWCWYPSNSTSFATNTQQRPVTQSGQKWTSNELMPAGLGGPPGGCLNSGTLSMQRAGLYDIECSISGMQYDVDKRPTTYNSVNTVPDHIFYLSSYTIMVVQPFDSLTNGERITDRMNTSDCDLKVTISDRNLKATTISGDNIAEDSNGVSNQSVKTNDSAAISLNVKEPGTFSAWGYYTRNYGITSGVDMKNWTFNYGNGYDTLPLGYNDKSKQFMITAGFGYGQYEDSQIPVYAETLVKFDPNIITIGEVPTKPTIKTLNAVVANTKQWSASFKFGIKRDGSAWTSDEEQRTADWSDLIWYDSKEEAESKGTIVAFTACLHTPVDNSVWGTANIATFMPFEVTSDIDKVNSVAAMTIRSRYWTRGTLYDEVSKYVSKPVSNLTFDDYQSYSTNVLSYLDPETDLPEPTSIYAHDTGFEKTQYDDNGPIANQTGTSLNGDSLLVTAEQSSIKRTVSQIVSGKNKTTYDMDYNERYADIELQPSATMSIEATESSDFTTTLTITDTLPKGMTYIPGSCYMGGTYTEMTPDQGQVVDGMPLNPSVTTESDGTTTLKWVLTNVKVNEKIEPIRYSVSIGDQSDPNNDVINNQELTSKSTISSTNDIRQKSESNGNMSTYTIKVSKLRQSNLSISVSPRFNEINADFSYTSSIGNYGTNPITDVYGIFITPNDVNSSYSGSYSIPTLTIDSDSVSDTSDISIYASSDTNIKNTDPNTITLDTIKNNWTKISIQSDNTINVPESLKHMTAWCIVKGTLQPDERVIVNTLISPDGNTPKDDYNATMSDGTNTVKDTAYVVQRNITGRVWCDDNANSKQDSNESGITGIRVSVIDMNGNTIDLITGGKATTNVSSDGTYTISNVPNGTFKIKFEEESNGALIGYKASQANVNGISDLIDSDANATYGADGWVDSGTTDPIIMPTIEDMTSNVYSAEHIDFGVYPYEPEISLVKSVDKKELENDEAIAGTSLIYEFNITNTGNTILQNINISDPLLDAAKDTITIDWESSTDKATGEGTLSPGETVTASAFYNVTQDDVDNLGVKNTATVTASTPYGDEVSDEDNVATIIMSLPSVSLSKAVDKEQLTGGDAIAGNTLKYEFIIENTGNTTLSSVELSDELSGIQNLHIDWNTSTIKTTGTGTLAPNETVNASATYNIKQSDIDAGQVINTATASGKSPQNKTVTDTDNATTRIERKPSISILKESSEQHIEEAYEGYNIDFNFTITNTGNVTLNDITLEDQLPGIQNLRIDWNTSTDANTATGVLVPNESVTGTANYHLTQQDVDSDMLTNTASTSGISPDGEKVSDNDEINITINATSDYTASKTVDKTYLENESAYAGEILTYSFNITNNGHRTLHDVKITDHLNNIEGTCLDWSTHTNSNTEEMILSPNEQVKGTATYRITQSDIDTGYVINTATVQALQPNGEAINKELKARTEIKQSPSIALEKTASTTRLSGDDAQAGTEVQWFFKITNTGNTTLSNITIDDPLIGNETIEYGDWNRILLPGASYILSAPYDITQEDVDNGSVVNTATAQAQPPIGDNVLSNQSEAKIDIDRNGVLSLEKTVDKTHIDEEEAIPGTQLSYEFTITNNGNTTLSEIHISDPLDGISQIEFEWNNEQQEETLAPGESIKANADYLITQDDINNGYVFNKAQAFANSPEQQEIPSNESSVLTTICQSSSIDLIKTVDRDSISPAYENDVLNYTFTITNTGNTTLKDVTLSDALDDIQDVEIDWMNSTDNTTQQNILLPGESVNGTAWYSIKQQDIDNGKVVNTATATGATMDFPSTLIKDEATAVTKLEPENSDILSMVNSDLIEQTGDNKPIILTIFTLIIVASAFSAHIISKRTRKR